MITQAGALNTTALQTPDLYIQIVPPQISLLNGVPTNVVGLVGTAAWGPKNAPVDVSGPLDYARQFGNLQNRKYDMGSALAVASLQGSAAVYKCVRVSDGTDLAAAFLVGTGGALAGAGTVVSPGTGYSTAPVLTVSAPDLPGGVQATAVATVAAGAITGVTFSSGTGYFKPPTIAIGGPGTGGAVAAPAITQFAVAFMSKYTGSAGTGAKVILSTGSAVGTFKVVVAMRGYVPETYDNIAGSGATFWTNLANAINLGQNGVRGPSELVVAYAGGLTTAATAAEYTLAGGTDGAGVNSTHMLGTDVTPRTGMYALRNSRASIAALVDCDTSTTWTTQVAYGLAEGTYMLLVGPSSDTISNAVSVKNLAGIDSYAAKLCFGDYVYFNDTVNGQVRMISPQGFFAGMLGNLAPSESSLNKPMQGVVATQKSMTQQPYSSAELQELALAGIDVITNPIPAGNVFGARMGRNTSSNVVTHGDNYTRMTNYIAATLNAGMGRFVGKTHTSTLRRNAKATLNAFLSGLADQKLIGTANDEVPYQVVLDDSNNLPSRVALGYMQADVKVIYLAIVEYFIVNLEGGQSVVITRRDAGPLVAQA